MLIDFLGPLYPQQMSDHVKRIEEVEKRIEKIREESARKDDVGKVRGEMKAVFVSPLFRLC